MHVLLVRARKTHCLVTLSALKGTILPGVCSPRPSIGDGFVFSIYHAIAFTEMGAPFGARSNPFECYSSILGPVQRRVLLLGSSECVSRRSVGRYQRGQSPLGVGAYSRRWYQAAFLDGPVANLLIELQAWIFPSSYRNSSGRFPPPLLTKSNPHLLIRIPLPSNLEQHLLIDFSPSHISNRPTPTCSGRSFSSSGLLFFVLLRLHLHLHRFASLSLSLSHTLKVSVLTTSRQPQHQTNPTTQLTKLPLADLSYSPSL